MKVKKLMKKDVGFCGPEDDLTSVAGLMRQRNCGVIPVVNDEKQVIGIITDRDIGLAIVDGDKKGLAIKAKDLLGNRVISCRGGDKIEKALRKMGKNQIKRLPVVGTNKEIVGILSITDFLISARQGKNVRKKIYATLKAIGKPRRIILRETADS